MCRCALADSVENTCDDDIYTSSDKSSCNAAHHNECKASCNDNNNNDDYNVDDPSEIIKSKLFEYIASSKTLPKLVAAQDFDGVSHNIILTCYNEILSIGLEYDLSRDKILEILATVILHYGLTKAFVKSQRKIIYDKTHLDIVIPDVKTLVKDPLRTLVICVATTEQADTIYDKMLAISKIQPTHKNIWLITSD